MNRSRRNVCISAFVGLGTLLCKTIPGAQAFARAGSKIRVIKIQVRKFSYAPNEIVLKKGETVELQFTAVDFMHGFKIPDLDVRADLMPGRIVTVRLHIKEAGEYAFLCDNFCGTGHEEMNGKIVVTI